MRVSYQRGYLRSVKRKNGSSCWEFMWREQDGSGKRVRRTAVIGTAEQYPTEESAQEAVRGLRMQINEARNRQPHQSICVADLIDHYVSTELAADWHSHATRMVYREFLTRWIKPHWGSVNIRDVRTVAVEGWLRKLRRQDGGDLANSTKAKIRSVMSVLFNHAIRYEWLEQGRNPITFVRQSAQRKNAPAVLEAAEIQSLLSELEQPFRLMVLLDVTTGLRRSELFALKWTEIDFWNLVIEIRRSICEGVVGNCKTEASRSPIPLSLDVAADLWLWKENTNYAAHDDWVFASPRLKGKSSRRPDVVLAKVIQPAALRAGIKKRIGWHTFRHTYSTTLIANGENVKVVQELMRHANSRCTLDVYSQARASAKREAQQRIVEMVLPENGLTSEIKLQRRGPDERLSDGE
jgi:integrase